MERPKPPHARAHPPQLGKSDGQVASGQVLFREDIIAQRRGVVTGVMRHAAQRRGIEERQIEQLEDEPLQGMREPEPVTISSARCAISSGQSPVTTGSSSP